MELVPCDRYYRAFGLTLGSSVQLAYPNSTSAADPEIFFTISEDQPVTFDLATVPPLYISRIKTRDSYPVYRYLRVPGWDVVSFTETGDFYISSQNIVFHSREMLPWNNLQESYLFSIVLPLWLELNTLVTLHASAVIVADRAVVFLAHKGGGKSTLAAAFLKRGFPLLTDDVLPVRLKDRQFEALPGYASLRMWPEEARVFWGREDMFERVHPDASKRRIPIGYNNVGLFFDRPARLGRFYIIDRRPLHESNISVMINSLSLQQSFVNLLRFSYAPLLTQAAGLAGDKFNLLAALTNQVSVCSLTYASGISSLDRLIDLIEEDICHRV